MASVFEDNKKKEAQEHERALFDFDEEINNLDEVIDRYPVVKESLVNCRSLTTIDDNK